MQERDPAAGDTGHRRPRPGSPFAAAAPSITLAVAYAVGVGVWLAAGDVLPGGRWLAVHIFTLGVLTNLVLTFSEHFGRTVTRTSGERRAWWPLITNAGVLAVLVGLPTGQRWLLGAGATTVTVSVFAAYRRLRRMRRTSLGARFGWIVRIYERAHGAFIHGAVLGAVLGIGVVPGTWYSGVRAAHLHANVLGWGGLTLLATLVFFGPTMARTRIEPGADGRAARALRHGATGLTISVLALVLTGWDGVVGTVAHGVAAVGLLAYTVAAVTVCLPVGRAVYTAKRTAPRPLVLMVCVWLPLVAGLDTLVVVTTSWRWLDALGVVALAGVLAQAILATLVYLAPMLRGGTTTAREVIRRRLEVGLTTRAVLVNLGVAMTAAGAAPVAADLPLTAVGWSAVATAVLVTLLTALWPVRAPDPPSVAHRPGHRVVGRGPTGRAAE